MELPAGEQKAEVRPEQPCWLLQAYLPDGLSPILATIHNHDLEGAASFAAAVGTSLRTRMRLSLLRSCSHEWDAADGALYDIENMGKGGAA